MSPEPNARKVLIYGEYPPTPGPEAATTLAEVRSLLAQGAQVEVVSPWPSGAHHHAHVDGMRGNVRFATVVARYRPDELIVHLDATLLRRRRGGRTEPAARRLLGVALRDATVHLPPLAGRLDPAYVDLVLARVDRVVADTPADAEALIEAGVPRARVGTRLPPEADAQDAASPAPARAPWSVDGPVTREALEAEVRRRAAADRGDLTAGRDPEGVLPPSRPLDRIPAYGDPPTWSPRPLARLVKQMMWRLTKWEVEPLVDHVNLVHRATRAETGGQPSPSSE